MKIDNGIENGHEIENEMDNEIKNEMENEIGTEMDSKIENENGHEQILEPHAKRFCTNQGGSCVQLHIQQKFDFFILKGELEGQSQIIKNGLSYYFRA